MAEKKVYATLSRPNAVVNAAGFLAVSQITSVKLTALLPIPKRSQVLTVSLVFSSRQTTTKDKKTSGKTGKLHFSSIIVANMAVV